MKQTKKRVLGFICLAFVAIMTSVASCIPAEETAAVSSITDTIKVIVYDKFPQITLTKPTDSSFTVNPLLEIGISYENVSHTDFILKYTRDEVEYEYTVATFEPTEDVDPDLYISTGEAVVGPVDLEAYGGYGDYTITAVAKGVNEYDEDIISFTYAPFAAQFIGTADNYDPIVNVDYAAEVSKVFLQAYDKKGNPVFDDPIVYNVTAEGTIGSKEFTLPFESYGVTTGDYILKVTGETAEGDPRGPVFLSFHFTQKPSPDVPKTGVFTGTLNISKTDYLITGLIVFAMAAICGFIIINNNNKKSKARSRSKSRRR